MARAASETAAPNTVTRTGVDARPRPGWSANRTPAAPAGETPEWARPSAIREGRAAAGVSMPKAFSRTLDVRHDGIAASRTTRRARAAPPPRRTIGSKLNPGLGSDTRARR